MRTCLTARMMDATEAERAGLVARVIPADKLLEETIAAAETIAVIPCHGGDDDHESINPGIRGQPAGSAV